MTFAGPAIVEDSGTTVVVHPGNRVEVDGYGNIHIHITSVRRRKTMPKLANDPITLEIIQNSLQATADEMFAVMKKTAMSSIIYEVLDMGTGITDAQRRAGVVRRRHPGLHRRARQGGEGDRREVRQAWRHRARRRVRHQRSLLWRRHASQRHHRRDAGFCRRAHHRLDGQHRPQFRRRRHGAGLADRRGDRDLPGGAAAARDQDHLEGRDRSAR